MAIVTAKADFIEEIMITSGTQSSYVKRLKTPKAAEKFHVQYCLFWD